MDIRRLHNDIKNDRLIFENDSSIRQIVEREKKL